eukprot:UC4_evm4s670
MPVPETLSVEEASRRISDLRERMAARGKPLLHSPSSPSSILLPFDSGAVTKQISSKNLPIHDPSIQLPLEIPVYLKDDIADSDIRCISSPSLTPVIFIKNQIVFQMANRNTTCSMTDSPGSSLSIRHKQYEDHSLFAEVHLCEDDKRHFLVPRKYLKKISLRHKTVEEQVAEIALLKKRGCYFGDLFDIQASMEWHKRLGRLREEAQIKLLEERQRASIKKIESMGETAKSSGFKIAVMEVKRTRELAQKTLDIENKIFQISKGKTEFTDIVTEIRKLALCQAESTSQDFDKMREDIYSSKFNSEDAQPFMRIASNHLQNDGASTLLDKVAVFLEPLEDVNESKNQEIGNEIRKLAEVEFRKAILKKEQDRLGFNEFQAFLSYRHCAGDSEFVEKVFSNLCKLNIGKKKFFTPFWYVAYFDYNLKLVKSNPIHTFTGMRIYGLQTGDARDICVLEAELALERHRKGNCEIIPVILRKPNFNWNVTEKLGSHPSPTQFETNPSSTIKNSYQELLMMNSIVVDIAEHNMSTAAADTARKIFDAFSTLCPNELDRLNEQEEILITSNGDSSDCDEKELMMAELVSTRVLNKKLKEETSELRSRANELSKNSKRAKIHIEELEKHNNFLRDEAKTLRLDASKKRAIDVLSKSRQRNLTKKQKSVIETLREEISQLKKVNSLSIQALEQENEMLRKESSSQKESIKKCNKRAERSSIFRLAISEELECSKKKLEELSRKSKEDEEANKIALAKQHELEESMAKVEAEYHKEIEAIHDIEHKKQVELESKIHSFQEKLEKSQVKHQTIVTSKAASIFKNAVHTQHQEALMISERKKFRKEKAAMEKEIARLTKEKNEGLTRAAEEKNAVRNRFQWNLYDKYASGQKHLAKPKTQKHKRIHQGK